MISLAETLRELERAAREAEARQEYAEAAAIRRRIAELVAERVRAA